MKGFPLYDFEKRLFLSYLPTELSWEAKIWYAHLVQALHVPFGDHDFSAPNMRVFGRFFLFFEFVLRITLLQTGLGS